MPVADLPTTAKSADALGSVIALRRRSARLDRSQLADLAGVPVHAIAQLERGQSAGARKLLCVLASLDIDLARLLARDPDPALARVDRELDLARCKIESSDRTDALAAIDRAINGIRALLGADTPTPTQPNPTQGTKL